MLPWYNLSLLENYLQVMIFCSSFLLRQEPFFRWNPICLQNSSYLWIIHICDLLLNAISFRSWDTRSNNSSKATHTVDAHTAEVSEVIVVLLHKVIKKLNFIVHFSHLPSSKSDFVLLFFLFFFISFVGKLSVI